MNSPSTDRIRNVAFVGHSGSGKTSVAEALLFRAGVIPRSGSTDDGSSVCDTEPEETKRKMSLSLAVAPFEWKAKDPATGEPATYKVNILDTPGLRRLRRRGRCRARRRRPGVVVVSAVDGIEVGTEAAWRRCDALGIPRLVFVNKEDKQRADFHAVLDALKARFGSGLVPLELPLGEEEKLHGIADVLSDEGFEYEPDGTHHTEPIPAEVADEEHRLHDEIVEEIVAGDDEQLERYLSGEVPTADELERTLAAEVLHCEEFPVLLGSALTGVGIDRLADYICELGPSPLDRPTTVVGGTEQVPVPADAVGAAVAYVFKTVADQFVGQVVAVQGAVGHRPRRRPPRQHADRHRGAAARTVPPARQGTPRRSTTSSPETSPPSPSWRRPRRTRRWPPRARPCGSSRRRWPRRRTTSPSSRSRSPTTTSSPTRSPGCAARTRRCRCVRPEETHQTVLCGAGDTHLAVALERLARKFGVNVTTAEQRVPYRETITASADADGKVKKQSGGHGQYAVVNLRVVSDGARARATSSSTRSSAARSRGTSSPPSRRASTRR